MTAETDRTRAWRRAMGLTMDELAELTGYSRESIFLMERGKNSLGKPHAAPVWRRYKLACLAVTILKHYQRSSIDEWEWTKGG